MGIFSRLRDIVNSNINAMLEKAEDPEKLIKLMIQEMEDTLVEIKASCASSMAQAKKPERALDEARARARDWAAKAELAVSKGREDLAREALLEKRSFQARFETLTSEIEHTRDIVEQYQNDIRQIEEKLAAAREKQRVLVQRHRQAGQRKRTETQLRQADTSDAFARFEQFENRIERMEAEASLVNYGRKPTLQEAFDSLQSDEEIEAELQALKDRAVGR